jgi:cytochrome c biogenesis protein CcmG, thiol:disulfide interchange protein DsbE
LKRKKICVNLRNLRLNQDSMTMQRHGRNPLVLLAGFAVLGVALAALLFGGDLWRGEERRADEPETPPAGRSPFAAASGSTPQIGDTAAPFTLPDFDGELVSLADFHGRPVIVNFWATWCAPCRVEMPEFQAVYEAYQDEGLVILALNQDEPLVIARRFFYDEMALTFTPLQDERRLVAAEYGAFLTMPTTYFINGEGLVMAVHRGPLTQSQLENYLSLTLN